MDLGKIQAISQLAGFGDSYVNEGDEVYVIEDMAFYVFSRTNQGTNSVTSTYLGGYWNRLESRSGEFASQASWVINYVSGSDDNSGADVSHPIKTFAKLMERVGSPWYLPNSIVTVLVQDNHPASDPLLLNLVPTGSSSQLVVTGAPTIIYQNNTTGFSARTALSRATNTRQTVTDAGAPFTANVGALLKDTTIGGPEAGYAWVTADLGAGQARISRMIQFDPVADAQAPTMVDPTVADHFQLLSLPTVVYLDVSFASNAPIAQNPVVVQNLLINDTTVGPHQGAVVFGNCKFTSGSFNGGPVFLANCFMGGTVSNLVGADTNMFAGVQNTGILALQGGRLTLDYDAYFEGGQLQVQPYSAGRLIIGGAAFFRTTGSGLTVESGLVASITNPGSGLTVLWGAQVGAGTTGAVVKSNGKLMFDSGTNFYVAGGAGGNDFTLGGATSAARYDPATRTYLAAVNTTWALLATAIGGGGFNNHAIDPITGAGVVERD